MEYQDVFVLFGEQVEKSIKEGSFAKLTMAKTIGKPKLKNIFVRPVYSKHGFSVLLKYRYRLRTVADTEEELTLDDAFAVLKEHLRNPFSSVIAFTTTQDLLFKINKKGVGSISESMPTFKNVTQAVRDVEG